MPVKLYMLILCCFVLLNALAGQEKAVGLLPHTTVAGETKGVLDVYLLPYSGYTVRGAISAK